MRNELDNIFAPKATVTKLVTIVKRIGPGRYEVEDGAGRRSVVTSSGNELWPKASKVVVQNERISGPGYRLGKHKTVEV